MSAGYHDLALVIYHLGDYRNEPEITAAWKAFVQETHEEAVAQADAEPYILVQERSRALGRRVNCSENVFNPRKSTCISFKLVSNKHQLSSSAFSSSISSKRLLNMPSHAAHANGLSTFYLMLGFPATPSSAFWNRCNSMKARDGP